MKYFLYDPATGVPHHFIETPEEVSESFIPSLDIIDAGGYSPADMSRVRITDGELTLITRPPVYVSTFEIKNEWLHREQAPILVGGYYLDCDPISELRIKNTIEAWDYLPLIPGQLEEDNGVRSVVWTLADNTKQRLLLVDLQNILPALVTARAVRAAVLYSAYQGLKVRSDVSHAVLKSDLTWG